MKVLVVGGGGREHAIAWKLTRDDPTLDLVAAPGNPGIAEVARCAPVGASDIERLVALADAERPDLTVVGPEAPLAAGLADQLRRRDHRTFGPSQSAARIESSKRFAKELMLEAGVPTAKASWHTDPEAARRAARVLGAPLVIKASGLASGKGVDICQSIEDADRAIDMMLREHAFGVAGSEILIEEFMHGEEISIFALCDGENFVTMLPAQDHKRLREGDEGPNTGGMGAYAPVAAVNGAIMEEARAIIRKTLAALRESGAPFSGVLYAGLMLTPSGAKVVEFNCRFGDPETQVVLPLLTTPLLDLLMAASVLGGLAESPEPAFSGQSAVTTVVSSPGYPLTPRVGAPITVSACPEGSILFHSGTKLTPEGQLLTAGGRVFSATGVGTTFEAAQRASLAAAGSITFSEAYFRRDIGWREQRRRARTT